MSLEVNLDIYISYDFLSPTWFLDASALLPGKAVTQTGGMGCLF